VAVVGLGGLGSAAAYWLARRGVDVVAFEQFELGHGRGASHDHSRIIRRSYHTPAYVELTAGAYDAWGAVEAESGDTIVTITGGIDLFPPRAAIDHRTYTTSLDATGVPYEWIDAGEIRRRWPAFDRGTIVDGDVMAICSPDTGIVPPARATAVMQRLAAAHGATLRPNTRVTAIVPTAGELDVVTEAGTVRVGTVILACDAWANRLLAPLGHAIPLTVLREQVTYFPTAEGELFAPGRFPVWIWMDDPSFYGFPAYGEADAVKGAEDCGGAEVDADTRTFDPDPAAERRLAEFMVNLVGPSFVGAPRSTTCLYTMTPDRDFVLDRLPGHPNVLVALGAAHGFKFASWFGRTLAELVVDGRTAADLSPFAFERASLHAALGRAAWLV
jgi:sarcosine oxidase